MSTNRWLIKNNKMVSNKKIIKLIIIAFSVNISSLTFADDGGTKAIKKLNIKESGKEKIVDEKLNSPKSKFASEVADHYLKSFSNELDELGIDLAKESTEKLNEAKPPELGSINRTQIIFNEIFGDSSLFSILEKNMPKVLNEYSWDDLRILYGTTSSPSYHLLSKINKTYSDMGKAVLACMLVTPTVNIKTLKSRQNIIKGFQKHKKDTADIKLFLKVFKSSENSILSFWSKKDPLFGKEYVKYMNSYFYSKTNKKYNKSTFRLELDKRFYRDFLGIQLNFIYPYLFIGIMDIAAMSSLSKKMLSEVRKYNWPMFIPVLNWFRMPAFTSWQIAHSSTGTWDPKGPYTIFSLWNVLYGWRIYKGISNYKSYSGVLRRLALRMSDIQNFIKSLESIDNIISKNPELEKIYAPKLMKVRELLNTDTKTELGRLVYYMKNLPLKSWSYFFNNAGKLLASYKLFLEHKDKLTDALFEFGQLDMYISISTLMEEAKSYNQDNCYSYTKYLDRTIQSKPYLEIKDMWNIFIDSKVAVINSLYMDSINGIRNMILTGPNAGGKSTFLTGMTTTILLSQVFGIGPAKSIIITPFNKISTYINLSDDIAAGKSLFMAEADRAKKHINTLTQLKGDEFSFTIMDELFSGTNPFEGGSAAFSIMEYLSKYDNALNIIATHFPVVMLLEKAVPEGRFRNYKVYIKDRNKGEKISYTFKVVPGKSTQSIAIDILEEQGYEISMLNRARNIISNRNDYKTKFSD